MFKTILIFRIHTGWLKGIPVNNSSLMLYILIYAEFCTIKLVWYIFIVSVMLSSSVDLTY